jgi:hypothetical protein
MTKTVSGGQSDCADADEAVKTRQVSLASQQTLEAGDIGRGIAAISCGPVDHEAWAAYHTFVCATTGFPDGCAALRDGLNLRDPPRGPFKRAGGPASASGVAADGPAAALAGTAVAPDAQAVAVVPPRVALGATGVAASAQGVALVPLAVSSAPLAVALVAQAVSFVATGTKLSFARLVLRGKGTRTGEKSWSVCWAFAAWAGLGTNGRRTRARRRWAASGKEWRARGSGGFVAHPFRGEEENKEKEGWVGLSRGAEPPPPETGNTRACLRHEEGSRRHGQGRRGHEEGKRRSCAKRRGGRGVPWVAALGDPRGVDARTCFAQGCEARHPT